MSTKESILVSGGMDPLHVGHLDMVEHAAEYAEVTVVLNTDEWLMRKKGYVFMPLRDRIRIVSALDAVRFVFPMSLFSGSDNDNTVIAAIRELKPTYFANGGDRTKENVPEQTICDELGVEMLWSIGGDHKAASSSELVQKAREAGGNV